MTTDIGGDQLVMNSGPLSSSSNPEKSKKNRQRPLGPAPFASFEDSSDELDSPPESARAPGLPNITEDPASQLATPVNPLPPPAMNTLNLTEEEVRGLQEALSGGLDTPAPPRIDISRASSSSQHEDSFTSSPDQEGPHNLGYKEEGALDLKSSTEEIDYTQEAGTVEEAEARRKRERMMRKQQKLRQDFGDTQSEHDFKERKDSNCSVASDFGGLLYIGGRSSRLSSVGSAASGGSAASHLSGASHLSADSRMSRGSRSPSPHKMMLETSFCGGRPAESNHVVDARSAPALVSHIEKPNSRPPSRLRSRSPSPHKMLLETSFCGTKAVGATPAVKEPASKQMASRKSSNTSTIETATGEVVSHTPNTIQQKHENNLVTESVKDNSKPRNADVVSKKQDRKQLDEIRKAEDSIEPAPVPRVKHQRKPVDLGKMLERKIQMDNSKAKKKKVISIRDIPGDEIFIPLKGPEVDFDALIRKKSPIMNVTEPSQDNPDVIFIPLHSPPKEKEVETELQNVGRVESNKSQSKKEPKPYEMGEDGTIYIPLHTPEEEKSARTFDEEIRRVERELQRVKAEVEKKSQQKLMTLEIPDSPANQATHLSQSYPGAKQDFLSGSRTPSPGSSLSRKSSFASLFRRNDLSASPDSVASVRKKSATLGTMTKDATDGIRDRSRSRSKSRERTSSSTGVSRSPSLKKNVLGGLFTKKKEDRRPSDEGERQVTALKPKSYSSYSHFQGEDKGDYILIPLKDPDAPSENYTEEPIKLEVQEDHPKSTKETSSVTVEKFKESPGKKRRSQDLEEKVIVNSVSAVQIATVGAAYPEQEVQLAHSPLTTKARPVPSESRSSSLNKELEATPQTEPAEVIVPASPPSPLPQTVDEPVQLTSTLSTSSATIKPSGLDNTMQDSSVELEDDLPREELVTVSADGVRQLKLPPEPGDLEEDHERKGLVVQDSFEDELPYVPTTLPQERSLGVTLIPAKERVSEVKTCPIDRPRSTTPKNPTSLDDFMARRDSTQIPDKEKMKISLPVYDVVTGRVKSPRRFSGKGKSWFEFAEAGLPSPRDLRKGSLPKSPSPPPLPPRSDPSATEESHQPPSPAGTWINFEQLPEKRKLPKRITTLPTHHRQSDGGGLGAKSPGPVVFSYVNPEDCQCECHDHGTGDGHSHEKHKIDMQPKLNRTIERDVEVTLICECCAGTMEESSLELDIEECPLLDNNSDEESVSNKFPINQDGSPFTLAVQQPILSDSSYEACSIGADNSASEMIPFAMDLDVHSNRSSIISQKEESSTSSQ